MATPCGKKEEGKKRCEGVGEVLKGWVVSHDIEKCFFIEKVFDKSLVIVREKV